MKDKGVRRTALATPGLLMSDGGVSRTVLATPGILITGPTEWNLK